MGNPAGIERIPNRHVAPYEIPRNHQDEVRSRARLTVYRAAAAGRGIRGRGIGSWESGRMEQAHSFYLANADRIVTSSVTPWAENVQDQMQDRNYDLEKRNIKLIETGRADEVVEIQPVPTVQEMRLERAGEIFALDASAACGATSERLLGWIADERRTIKHLQTSRKAMRAALKAQGKST